MSFSIYIFGVSWNLWKVWKCPTWNRIFLQFQEMTIYFFESWKKNTSQANQTAASVYCSMGMTEDQKGERGFVSILTPQRMSNLLSNLLQHKFHNERTWKASKQLVIDNTSNIVTENNQTTNNCFNLMYSRNFFLEKFLLLLVNILDFTVFFED